MHENIITAGMLIGGLGLFMLAINMITDGLTSAAGHALRSMLGKWTRSPVHGILSGLTMTALVQSSSAVTVATIGFVNAGLISMHKSLGVVYGSNIGTTMTGWLVAMVGFRINIEMFALPLIGVGMLLRLTGGESKRAFFGLALAGFGLFFIGIDVLRDAFEGLVLNIDLNQYSLGGIWGILMFVVIGFLMTVLTQSSSAAIAIILTAASGGVVDIHTAAAMVIGANVGTTSTAAITVIGATANAKRVASAHIIFNVVTGVVALLILPVLFWTIQKTEILLGWQTVPAVTLAMFHTTFNVLGVMLILPLNKHLARFLDKRFVTQDEIEGRPRYLDKSVAVSPVLAVNALALELSRITTVVRRMSLEALSSEFVPSLRIRKDLIITRNLSREVAKFITRLERGMLSKEISEQLAMVLRTEQHLLACANQALEITRMQDEVNVLTDEKIIESLSRYRADVVNLIKKANPEEESFSISECELKLDKIQNTYVDVKEILLSAGAELRVPIPVVIDILEQNNRIRRLPRQMVRAMRHLSELSMIASVKTPDMTAEPDDDNGETPGVNSLDSSAR
jgi:phosphate:Na+ symporter